MSQINNLQYKYSDSINNLKKKNQEEKRTSK